LKYIESVIKKHLKGVESAMGTIICQDCQRVIEHFEDEKVSTLYGNCCSSCKSKNKHKA